MATDGVKIIDGDDAHDNHLVTMDLYDSEVGLKEIEKEYPLKEIDFYDDFENEIHVTSLGLAYWEIGLMNEKKLQLIQEIIERGAGIEQWSDYSEKEGKARAAVLKRFLKKISSPNTKIRKIKKYRLIKNFYFYENDVLAFKAKNSTYRVVICAKIEQYRGHCSYYFVPTSYENLEKPTIDVLKKKTIIGHQIGSGCSREETRKTQPGIEKIWEYIGGVNNFTFGLVIKAIDHKNLFTIKDNFTKIGSLKIKASFKKVGSIGYESSFENFQERFENIADFITIFKYQEYPIKIVCE